MLVQKIKKQSFQKEKKLNNPNIQLYEIAFNNPCIKIIIEVIIIFNFSKLDNKYTDIGNIINENAIII